MATANPKKPSDESRTNATYVKFHTGSEIGDKPEHDPLNNNNYIYIFRNIKSLNYVLFLLCSDNLNLKKNSSNKKVMSKNISEFARPVFRPNPNIGPT
jgi:hypothetical protein